MKIMDTNFSNLRATADFTSLKNFTTKENKPIMKSVKFENSHYAIFSTFLLLMFHRPKCSPWTTVVEHPQTKRMIFSLKCETTLFISLFLVYFTHCLLQLQTLIDIYTLII
jgi:hypothetical protein